MAIQFFFIFWLGHDLGCELGPNLAGLNGGLAGAGLGPEKKTQLVNGPGSSRGLRPAGWVWVWKNSARI